MGDASKDEIVQCGCGWCGTRENAGYHRRTDPRHTAERRIAELEAERDKLKAEVEELRSRLAKGE